MSDDLKRALYLGAIFVGLGMPFIHLNQKRKFPNENQYKVLSVGCLATLVGAAFTMLRWLMYPYYATATHRESWAVHPRGRRIQCGWPTRISMSGPSPRCNPAGACAGSFRRPSPKDRMVSWPKVIFTSIFRK